MKQLIIDLKQARERANELTWTNPCIWRMLDYKRFFEKAAWKQFLSQQLQDHLINNSSHWRCCCSNSSSSSSLRMQPCIYLSLSPYGSISKRNTGALALLQRFCPTICKNDDDFLIISAFTVWSEKWASSSSSSIASLLAAALRRPFFSFLCNLQLSNN